MKKQAKILVVIGIIWIVTILIFNSILYFKVKQFSDKGLNEEDAIAMGNWRGLIETVDGRSHLLQYFFIFYNLEFLHGLFL